MISVLVAAGLIVNAILGVSVSAFYLKKTLNRSEVTEIAVAAEAILISAFNNKINFPDPAPGIVSPNPALRSGSLPSLSLTTGFGTVPSPVVVSVPIEAPGSANATFANGYLDLNLMPCPGYSASCILHYQIRLQKNTIGTVSVYSFAYQIDINPDVLPTAPLGNINAFETPVNPGLYRAEFKLSNCDPTTDLFMTGLNRDTGEAFCAVKPLVNKCPDGTIPKGMVYVQFTNQSKAGTLKLDCTAAQMRTFRCPQNYALAQFDPRYVDPEYNYGNTVPGVCIFQTRDTANSGTYPANPTSPYLSRIEGNICPPYYKATGTGCNLVPDTGRNTDINFGKGKCGTTKYKNCTRNTYTDTWVSNMTAWNAWNVDCTAKKAMIPPQACAPEPPTSVISRTCSVTETSTYCSGVPDVSSPCATKPPWSSGTAYADNFVDTYPTASPSGSASARSLTCTFTDTSTSCTAPDVDFSGNPWGKKNPKWYGGVQISGAGCVLDSSQAPLTQGAY